MSEYDLTMFNEDQRLLYDDLMNQSKLLYPDYPEKVLQTPVIFYILSGCDENCFIKLEEKNKSNSNIERDPNYEYEESI